MLDKTYGGGVPFVDLNRALKDILPNIKDKFEEIIRTSRFISGKYVAEFEGKFSKYLGVNHCIAVNSGTSAIYLSLKSIGIKSGDEVIIPANTFIATAGAVSLLEAKPVFTDINEKTFTIDVGGIEEKITRKTRAIIPVHLYGQCADMSKINQIAKKHKLCVIEDACQAHGAEYKNKKAGSLGDIAAFSFYPTKNLGTFGEGGVVVTNNDEIAYKIKLLRDHGSRKKYYHTIIGGNFRMIELMAVVLSIKVEFLDEWNNMRRDAAKMYNELLRDSETVTPYEASYNKHVYHLYVVRVKKRDKVRKFLAQYGIETGIHYPTPLHLEGAYRFLNIPERKFPVAEKVVKEILSLPIFPYIKEDEINYVATTLNKVKR